MFNRKLRKYIIILVITIALNISICSNIENQYVFAYQNKYINPRFSDRELNYCYFNQTTPTSCGSACVRMVLKYLNVEPLPPQEVLAVEMRTTVNKTTLSRYMYLPFKNRGYNKFINRSLSNNFEQALAYLKGNLTKNFPVIILTWYSLNHKSGHYRVVVGYNETGVFVHDPHPRKGSFYFINDTVLEKLWEYSRYWALIIEDQPRFNLTIEIKGYLGFPIKNLDISISGPLEETLKTNSSGIALFKNILIGQYEIRYNVFGRQAKNITLTRSIKETYIVLTTADVFILLIIFVIILIAFKKILLYRITR